MGVPRLRTFAMSLVFYLSLADLGAEVAFFMGAPKEGSALCTVQAVLFQFCGVAGMLWTCVIARVVYTATRFPQSVLGLRQNEYRLHAFVWGSALAATLLPATTQDYGVAGAWCWIGNDNPAGSDSAWRYLTYYVPLWIAMAFNLAAYGFVRATLKEVARISGSDHARASMPPALLYPLVLVVANIFATVNRIQNSVKPDEPVFALYVLHELFNNLTGLGNAVVFFGFTPRVIASVRERVTGRALPRGCGGDGSVLGGDSSGQVFSEIRNDGASDGNGNETLLGAGSATTTQLAQTAHGGT